jgi:hypothetical protein
MVLGFILAWYFAGPIVAELARNAFEIYYSWRFGYIPSAWSVEYYFTFMPMRGHVTHYAYLYGHKICALIAAPLFYKLPEVILVWFRSNPEETQRLYLNNTKPELADEANDFLVKPSKSFCISHKAKPLKGFAPSSHQSFAKYQSPPECKFSK